jgi:hypothetical protein
MKRGIKTQITGLLILAIFAYGLAASVDVFYSAFFLPEEASSHSHTSPSSLCGFVYESPDYLCVHNLPVLDTYEAPVIEPGSSIETVLSQDNDPILAFVFNYYRFRAPPIHQTTSSV